jgi:peptidoglycan/xylan/chitin deacetylase (PgdA/CDA1 family)
MYHTVETSERPRFHTQMRLLRRWGYQVTTLEKLIGLMLAGGRLPAKTVVLTFDDGTSDHHRVVLPVFRECGLVGTFFVSSGLVGTEKWMIKDGSARTRRMFDSVPGELNATGEGGSSHFDHMTWEEVVALHNAGQEIGAHGMTHLFLTGVTLAEAEREIRLAGELLAERLGRPIATFCYPFGDQNAAVRELVRKAGYRGACLTVETNTAPVSFDDLFALGRVPANPRMPMWWFLALISGLEFRLRTMGRLPGMAAVLRARREIRAARRRRKAHA